MSALNAAALVALAGEIDERLDNEHADRQTICEDVAVQLRYMAAAAREPGAADADSRVTAAREHLVGARRRKVSELPPSLLVRECAELRRQLGQVLDVLAETEVLADGDSTGRRPDGSATIAPADVPTVLEVLAGAAEYRRNRAALTCRDCDAEDGGLCPNHATDLDRADEYDRLSAQIGDSR